MASFVQCAMYDSYSTGPRLHWIWRVMAIRESTVTFNKSLYNLHLRFIYHTDVLQRRQPKLMTQLKKMQMISIKGWLVTDLGERSMLLGFDLTFKCQQHVLYLSLLVTE